MFVQYFGKWENTCNTNGIPISLSRTLYWCVCNQMVTKTKMLGPHPKEAAFENPIVSLWCNDLAILKALTNVAALTATVEDPTGASLISQPIWTFSVHQSWELTTPAESWRITLLDAGIRFHGTTSGLKPQDFVIKNCMFVFVFVDHIFWNETQL